MKKPLAILLIFLHILPSIPFAKQAQTIAVIEFEGLDISQVAAKALTNELESYLSNMGIYRVVERGQMENILQEQGLQQTGCISSECAVEVGQALGAQLLVSGSISKIGTIYSIAAKILDVETGEVIKSANYRYRGEDIGELLEGMADIATQLTGKSVNKTPVVTKPSSITPPKTPPSVPYTRTEKPRSVKYGPGTGSVVFNFNTDSLSSWSLNNLPKQQDLELRLYTTDGNNTQVNRSYIKNIYNPQTVTLPSGLYRIAVFTPIGYKDRIYDNDGGTPQLPRVVIKAGETRNIKIYISRSGEQLDEEFGLLAACGLALFIGFLAYGSKKWGHVGDDY